MHLTEFRLLAPFSWESLASSLGEFTIEGVVHESYAFDGGLVVRTDDPQSFADEGLIYRASSLNGLGFRRSCVLTAL